MMPLAPTPIVPIPTKPKIGFSIESLVGKDSRSANCTITTTTAAAATSNGGGSVINANSISRPSSSNAVETSSRTSSSPSPSSSPRDRMDKRARSVSPLMIEGYDHPHHHHHHHHHHAHHHSHSEPQTSGSPSTPPVRPNVRCESPVSPVSSTGAVPVSSAAHHPIVSIHAPTASMAPNPFMDTLSSLKGIYAPEPTYTNGMVPGLMAPQPLPCAPLAHVPQHVGFPNLSPLFLGNIGTVGPHQLHREAYPLYPWLLSRQGRFLGHRFQGPDAPAFLLQPFRKPKRIRTAFSPSQLLKLEHAFEKNHYVVGAERKHLAQTLSLTETQVKVWFQNRRTKHKRLKQEEEQSQSSPPSPKKKAPFEETVVSTMASST